MMKLAFRGLDKSQESAAVQRPSRVFEAIVPELNRLSTHRFPRVPTEFKGIRVSVGSLDVVVQWMVQLGAVYAFVAAYPDFRKGLVELTRDIESVGEILSEKLRDLFSDRTIL